MIGYVFFDMVVLIDFEEVFDFIFVVFVGWVVFGWGGFCVVCLDGRVDVLINWVNVGFGVGIGLMGECGFFGCIVCYFVQS